MCGLIGSSKIYLHIWDGRPIGWFRFRVWLVTTAPVDLIKFVLANCYTAKLDAMGLHVVVWELGFAICCQRAKLGLGWGAWQYPSEVLQPIFVPKSQFLVDQNVDRWAGPQAILSWVKHSTLGHWQNKRLCFV